MKRYIKWLRRCANIVGFLLFTHFSMGQPMVPRLHLLLISDTHDAYIGQSCFANAKRIRTLAEDVAQNTGLQLQVYALQGDSLQQAVLPQWISRIQPAKNDVVWLYYSGHGLNQRPDSQWPSLLAGKSGAVFLPTLHDLLVEKGARLTLTTADCCNVTAGSAVPSVPVIKRNEDAPKADSTEIAQRYRTLFCNQEGEVLSSGCLKGQQSYASPLLGGFFTWGIAEALYQITHTPQAPSWVAMLEEARRLTQATAAAECRTQTPQFQVRLKPLINPFRKGETVISLD